MASGCLSPEMKDSRGINSPMMTAYQASLPEEQPFPFPLSQQSQVYALTGGILILMVFIILKASQFKEK